MGWDPKVDNLSLKGDQNADIDIDPSQFREALTRAIQILELGRDPDPDFLPLFLEYPDLY